MEYGGLNSRRTSEVGGQEQGVWGMEVSGRVQGWSVWWPARATKPSKMAVWKSSPQMLNSYMTINFNSNFVQIRLYYMDWVHGGSICQELCRRAAILVIHNLAEATNLLILAAWTGPKAGAHHNWYLKQNYALVHWQEAYAIKTNCNSKLLTTIEALRA